MRRFIAIAALAAAAGVGCAGLNPPACGVVRSAYEPVPVYRLGCPDVIAVRYLDRPQLDCLVAVDLDGRLPVSDAIQPHVEGETLTDARQSLAAAAGCDPTRVVVELADARTGRVYMFGPELNRQRIVPFIGSERLLDLLHRTGGLTDNTADLRDVFVLRPNVAAGLPPVVFRAHLWAIQAGDHTTNVPLEPGDQIHVGENRRSSFARLLPDWLKPTHRRPGGHTPAVER